jgi:hypothetical protein
VFRIARFSAVGMLAIAIASVPLILDRCATKCEMHHETVAGAPTCHHPGTTSPRLAQTPGTCGHDHSAAGVAPESGAIRMIHDFTMGVAFVTMPIAAVATLASEAVHRHGPPGPTVLSERLRVSLRI